MNTEVLCAINVHILYINVLLMFVIQTFQSNHCTGGRVVIISQRCVIVNFFVSTYIELL